MYRPRKIKIGSCYLGEDLPVRIQSMTSTNTMDTQATVEQCIRIFNAGADMVRLTVRNIREAENLKQIKNELRKRGFIAPLIADVHFNPQIAELAADSVEKVRINPGNFADSQMKDKFISLLQRCKKNNTALRIGVNHGSLSGHIMEKFGDTPGGMVESAMDYLRICKSEKFHDVVVSLKSSNTRIMIQSNRLLVKTMQEEGLDFPIHLGVTEAGEGDEGRIRSAIGIGTLLGEGIGNTIRISLTEDPEKEIPVAKKLVSIWKERKDFLRDIPEWDPFQFNKRLTSEIINIGGRKPPVVISSIHNNTDIDKILKSEIYPDYLYTPVFVENKKIPPAISLITGYKEWKAGNNSGYFPVFSRKELTKQGEKSLSLNFLQVRPEDIDNQLTADFIKETRPIVLILVTEPDKLSSACKVFNLLIRAGLPVPVIIRAVYSEKDIEFYFLRAASGLGRYFIDGLADGLWLENDNFSAAENAHLSLNILQASRARMFKAEYIACPSCGRTSFNIQESLASVKKATSHLRHLKIAVMGCIVNGPGEMADADYGFVGSGPGKIRLYKQKKIIKKNIPENKAVEELISLIRENDDWIDP